MSKPASTSKPDPRDDGALHEWQMASYRRAQQLIRLIMAALLVWGGLHGLGAYLYNSDWRKPLIVYACLLGFLGLWWLMLFLRDRRLRREFEELPDDDE